MPSCRNRAIAGSHQATLSLHVIVCLSLAERHRSLSLHHNRAGGERFGRIVDGTKPVIELVR